MKISSVLIANRGEIAVRIAKTAKRLGLKVYGLSSELDDKPLHQKYCDKTLFLNGKTLKETYLNVAQILSLMQAEKIMAVHPGYGFLSENEDFAKACEDAGVVFIGPKSPTIQAMGSKANAKNLMIKAGVPVVPGYQGADQSLKILTTEAQKIGAPLLVKASAGGGGKGMRIVRDLKDLESAIVAAKSESLKSFGDDHLILEKYIDNPRHIEFQIFGDAHGNVIHLGERECSIQRRHQKIIEETPSPSLGEMARQQMAKAAVDCGKALGYQNAGTVEFIVDEKDNFYFLEVNTRLQVEHPITELRTGLDLVEWQIRVAEGEPLPLKQNEVKFSGHALECRVYAEDPSAGFLPSIGELYVCDEPVAQNLRLDSGVEAGSQITLHFDPMIAKVVTWAPDRAQAIAQMQDALKEYAILGVTTNQAFLLDVLVHASFAKGQVDTHFIQKHLPDWKDVPNAAIVALAKKTWRSVAVVSQQGVTVQKSTNIWTHLQNFRIGSP